MVVSYRSGNKRICSPVLRRTLRNLGAQGRDRKKTTKAVGQAAEKAFQFNWLWLKIEEKIWKLSADT